MCETNRLYVRNKQAHESGTHLSSLVEAWPPRRSILGVIVDVLRGRVKRAVACWSRHHDKKGRGGLVLLHYEIM